MSDTITVRELIQRTCRQFEQAELYYGHGTDNALDEAFYLIMVAANLEFDCPDSELDRKLDTNELSRIESLITKRIQDRTPVAYLVNKAWFAGLEFYVDQNVLIPRSPLAELINSDFLPWKAPKDIKNILDIGTGSACIAIACATQIKHAKVDAIDIDDAAINIGKKNISKHGLEDRVEIIHSDLYQNLNNKKYDLIISNPPYVGRDEMQTLPEEYLHEPTHALKADRNGLAIVEDILRGAVEHLNEDGILIVEVGNSMQTVEDEYPEVPFIWLEFENGGEGVFLISKSDILKYFH